MVVRMIFLPCDTRFFLACMHPSNLQNALGMAV